MAFYQINSQHVAQESMEDEVVILHLDKGTYFNLQESGAYIWNALVAGFSTDEMLDSLTSTYEVDHAIADKALNQFLGELQAEELVIESNGTDANRLGNEIGRTVEENPKLLFTPPILQKYDDMQDLLLLDPLHDIDETAGWPVRKS